MSTKCETVGCKREATRLMSWRDPYYPELDRESDRTTDAVCADCLTSYQRRPALQARDEGPIDPGATARQLIGERE